MLLMATYVSRVFRLYLVLRRDIAFVLHVVECGNEYVCMH